MKTKNDIKEKSFDAVKFMREQRDRITRDIMDLSPEEIVAYFEKRDEKQNPMKSSA